MRRDSRGIGGGIVREEKQEEERREVQRNNEGEILLGAILPY
jgi:hypothetical protein